MGTCARATGRPDTGRDRPRQHQRSAQPWRVTGIAELDTLLGGGLTPGTNTLLTGPSGVGKTTTAMRCVLAALQRGERASYFLFDEGTGTLLSRSAMLSIDVGGYLATGQLTLQQIDPAELSPGEFAHRVRNAVEQHASSMIVVDSLNAYLQSMPGEQYLLLQMHEMLSYLNQRGVKTMLVLGQHGVVGNMRTDIDLSYLSDTILLFRFFEAQGQVRTALSVVKSRTTAHERTIREMKLSASGLQVGHALTDFDGVLSGLPSYKGQVSMLQTRPAKPVKD